ncbi:vacuolar fusion protein MON1 homolog A [Engraulis encrasicolus]|uniref:vacuolar fusion protein MON1 homolog A n=1 Tax=Engraulis encrasicolus TaxID=184585 RepID=UPI002FD29195
MAADVHTHWESSNGSLSAEPSSNGSLSVDELRFDRLSVETLRCDGAESPTPGLVGGTEPGAGQESAMFACSQSYEDLTAETQEEEAAILEEEGLGGEECTVIGRAPQEEGSAPQEAEGARDKDEDVTSEAWRAHRKHVFVLSEAGKPIYSRYGSEEALSSTMGVMMALVSFVQSGDNTIRSIHGDGYRVVFLRRSPLVLVGVSKGNQSDIALVRELQYVFLQVVSLLTMTQLNHVFSHKQNYDLRRLLGGAELLTDSLLRLLESDPGPLLSAVSCLPLGGAVRDAVSAALQQNKAPSLVFSVLLAGHRLVSLVRQRDQNLHHTDLTLLANLAGSSSCAAFREAEGWTPVCLPKFNPAGFFHAHISFPLAGAPLCLLLLSTQRDDFFTLSTLHRRVLERLQRRNTLSSLEEALNCPTYPASQVGIPQLIHFLYKSKSSGLYTSPEFPVPYCREEERQRLMSVYQQLHGRLHHPTRPMTSIYHTTHTHNLYARVTSGFELYVCFSPLATKAIAEAAVPKLLKWIRKEEDRLFILKPLTY